MKQDLFISALLFALMFIALEAKAMEPGQALQILRTVTEKQPLVAADHRTVEQAYQVLAKAIAEPKKEKATTPAHPSEPKKADDGSAK